MTAPGCPYCGDTVDLSPEKVAEMTDAIPLPLNLRAAAKVREKRIAACSGCDALNANIICGHCGCFVLFRARIKASYCPHPAGDRWLENRQV
jgi:hypothetical protein